MAAEWGMAAQIASQLAAATSHASETRFVFAHLGQSWLVLPLLVGIGVLAWWAWSRYGPAPQGWRGRVARSCRVAALVLAVLIAAGPEWQRERVTDLPYHVLVAVDRSGSMGRTDLPQGRPRIALAGDLARGLQGLIPANPLLAIDYRSIGAVDEAIDPKALIAGTVTTPGTSSPLADELDRLVSDTRPDLLIAVTDGRITAGSQLAATAARWHARDLNTLVLATGTDAIVPELFIDEIVANREAAKDEIEPITVRLSGRGLPRAPVTVTMTIEGEPPQTLTLDPPPVPPGASAELLPFEARLQASFHNEGQATLHLTAAAGTTLHAPSQDLTVQVRERRLSVLMLGDRPFYELRYLREAFKRDKTVTLHAYLAEGRWRRWGTEGPDNLPLQPEELAAYDAIIIGDLSREALRDADQDHIDKAVRTGGAGLVWLMSETGAIASFVGTRLGELLPVTLPDAQTVAQGFLAGQPRRLARTPIATSLGLLEPEEGADWPSLPPLLGAAPLTRAAIKPGADVLAEDQDGNPLVVTKAYPPGCSVLIGVDDTWRWRRNVGDTYLHRFQSQLLRFAAAGRRGGARTWQLFASPRRAVPGEPIVLNLTPLGEPDAPQDQVTVSLTGPNGAEQLVRMEREAKGFSCHLAAPAPGSWTIAVAAGIDPRRVDQGELKVLPPEDEMRDPRLDRPALDAFAQATGGTVYTDPARLLAALPKDLRRTESITVHAGLWDTWWALGALVTLLAIEWSLRRLSRLP